METTTETVKKIKNDFTALEWGDLPLEEQGEILAGELNNETRTPVYRTHGKGFSVAFLDAAECATEEAQYGTLRAEPVDRDRLEMLASLPGCENSQEIEAVVAHMLVVGA